MVGADGCLCLGWLGASTIRVPLEAAGHVTVAQETDYPYNGRIVMKITPAKASRFTLALRIPAWSAKTSCRVNGEKVGGVRSGDWLRLDRRWRRGDTLELRLDMSLHVWQGRRECDGLAAVYRGPILLSWDRRLNSMDPDALPPARMAGAALRRIGWKGARPPHLLLEARATDGQRLLLCDFASAGNGGAPYRSWLKVEDAAALRRSAFTPEHTPGA
jgi:hypothetical protein